MHHLAISTLPWSHLFAAFPPRLSGAHAFVTTFPWALIAAAAAAVQIFPVYMGVILPVLALLAAQNWVSAIVLMVGSVFSTNQLLAMFGGKNKDVSAAVEKASSS